MTAEPQDQSGGRPVQARLVAPPAPPPRRGRGLFYVLAAFLGLSVMLNLAFMSSSAKSVAAGGGLTLQQGVHTGGTGFDRILLIPVRGVIMGSSNPHKPGIVTIVKRSLQLAAADDKIKAIILRVDSPGGGVTASDQIYDAIQRFKKACPDKPVIVSMGGICASGGYYISAPADRIFAEHTTITGSIGVIMSGMNYHELLKKIGVSDVAITSGPNKALMSGGAPINDKHKAILQTMVNSMYGRFVEIVSAGRNIDPKTIAERHIADGRVFTSTQALELKLVDEIGYIEQVIEFTRNKINAKNAPVITYSRPATLADLFSVKSSLTDLRIERLLGSGPKFFYLWKP